MASQSTRNSIHQPSTVRNSLSLDVREYSDRNNRRRSESLDPPIRRCPLALNHRRNLSMEPQELSRDLAAAVDELQLISITKKPPPFGSKDVTAIDPTHDYAEIYTPSREKQPIWLKDSGPSSDLSIGTTTTTATAGTGAGDLNGGPARAPTPPLHRFPSWEAKIYQVANDGLTSGENSNRETSNALDDSSSADGTTAAHNRAHRTASGGYCDINVPVYATVKGVSYRKKIVFRLFFLINLFWFLCSVHLKFERCHLVIQVMIQVMVKIMLHWPHALHPQ